MSLRWGWYQSVINAKKYLFYEILIKNKKVPYCSAAPLITGKIKIKNYHFHFK